MRVRAITILILVLVALWIVWPANPGVHLGSFNLPLQAVRGLDLQGGLRVLLEADLPPGTAVGSDELQTARDIIESRVNALGVTEPVVQVAGARRILVELPGIEDTEQALEAIRATALLEFVDFSVLSPAQAVAMQDTTIQTDYGLDLAPAPTAAPGEAGPTPTAAAPVFHTVLTGADLESARVNQAQIGGFSVAIKLGPSGTAAFADYTSRHVNDILAIVLDKQIISMPSISQPILGGEAEISGDFTADEANRLAVQLRYGALPIPLKVVESKSVGPTLGQDSLQRSQQAGVIGLLMVIAFMILYYRLPGLIASIALLIYAVLTFSLFKLIPVTLTLPGVAGFILSLGMAVDANVLIFERLREELRDGRTLIQAVDLGFGRAWPSIRDSNFSTLITCFILGWFGGTFGASIVLGFAVTLGLGVLVSMFTAIVVTRTLLHLVLDRVQQAEHPAWFGV